MAHQISNCGSAFADPRPCPCCVFQIVLSATYLPQSLCLGQSLTTERGGISVKLPAFTNVLCSVLTNSPQTYPPECLFNTFNSTSDTDQTSSYTDYMQFSMQCDSLTIEHSCSRVSRSEGEGEEWVSGFGRVLPVSMELSIVMYMWEP